MFTLFFEVILGLRCARFWTFWVLEMDSTQKNNAETFWNFWNSSKILRDGSILVWNFPWESKISWFAWFPFTFALQGKKGNKSNDANLLILDSRGKFCTKIDPSRRFFDEFQNFQKQLSLFLCVECISGTKNVQRRASKIPHRVWKKV